MNFLSCSRKKRDTTKYEFKPEDVIVLHIKVLDNKVETEIALLLLDPTSTSLLPDSSFTSKELENLIVKIDEKKSNGLPFIIKRVGNVQIGWVLAKHLQFTTQPKTNKSVDILQQLFINKPISGCVHMACDSLLTTTGTTEDRRLRGTHIHIFVFTQLKNNQFKKKIKDTQSEYMNMGPLNYRSSAIPGQVCCNLSTDLLQVDYQNLSFTGLLQVVSTSCNKSANDKLQQA